jgi:desulfoferrodoxin (superoxide reductase-like protein)/rubredoxin
MKYLCINCNYIYDEMIWEIGDWIDYWTKLDDIREWFICPSCYEWEENFQEITPHINSLDEERWVLQAELEHLPIIELLDDWAIKIEVNHPWEESHFLWNIWIYDEYWDLIYEEFFKPWEPAYLEYDISSLDDFEIRTQCSLHGIFSKKLHFISESGQKWEVR